MNGIFRVLVGHFPRQYTRRQQCFFGYNSTLLLPDKYVAGGGNVLSHLGGSVIVILSTGWMWGHEWPLPLMYWTSPNGDPPVGAVPGVKAHCSGNPTHVPTCATG